jgi:Dyp-type peroxidase family
MAIDLSREEPVVPGNGYRKLLENLQGNILKWHGRDCVHLLPIRFQEGKSEAVQRWVYQFARERVTSAWRQLQEAKEHREGKPTGNFGGLYLTASGYRKLGFSDAGSRFDQPQELFPFSRGMAAYAASFGDDPSQWHDTYRSSPGNSIDGMVVLASDDEEKLAMVSGTVVAELRQSGAGELVGGQSETGKVRRRGNNAQDLYEPFGFSDGISQPFFFQKDGDEIEKGEPEEKFSPLDLVLLPDPYSPDEDCYGSFLVFRKLEQNVARFRYLLGALANRCTNGNKEEAAALVIGRFRNGTPLSKFSEVQHGPERLFNEFDFGNDSQGEKCPLHSHIRKANPRSSEEKARRIVRRAVPYAESSGAQGLLFLCFQSNISRQFGFIQMNWLNDPNSPQAFTGVDPVVGSNIESPGQRWPKKGRDTPASPEVFNFNGCVTCRGGDFFFVPSIPFLLNPVPPHLPTPDT